MAMTSHWAYNHSFQPVQLSTQRQAPLRGYQTAWRQSIYRKENYDYRIMPYHSTAIGENIAMHWLKTSRFYIAARVAQCHANESVPY